jgi:phi13 family phage major tail protein
MARNIGLKDVYVSLLTKNDATTYTAGAPTLLARAISAKISEKFNSENVYSDDALEDTIRSFESVEVELEINRLTPEKIALLFGQTLNKGMLTANINDQASEIALGYRSKLSNGKYEFVWYYTLKVSEGLNKDYATVEGKPKPQSDKIKLIGKGREKDGNYKVSVSEDTLLETDTDAKTAITTWFGTVPEPLAA